MYFGILSTLVATGGVSAASSRNALERQMLSLMGPEDAALLVSAEGVVLAQINADRLMIPASILKILTSLAALHYLGESYRYPTDFYLSPEGHLKVKGFGDPLLVSERLAHIGRRLADEITLVDALVLDDSYIEQPVVIPGRSNSSEPYDAPNGALCVNFNTVNFSRRNGRWVSAEPQTPLLESVVSRIKASGLSDGRITLAANGGEGTRYAGELLRYFLEKAGIGTGGKIDLGRIDPDRDRLLWRYESEEDLAAVIAGLLAHSNNFIANQLILTIGAHQSGPPATMDKGMRALRAYYRSVSDEEAQLVEGSGISRQNRISACSMMNLLERFQPYHHLMRREGRQWYKTGTLAGISTRAGYLDARSGGLYRFVVISNTRGRSAERIMRAAEKHLP